jgi:predicted metalloprotease with PDZ domain
MKKNIDEIIKNNKYLGSSFDDFMKEMLEKDEELRMLYEEEKMKSKED